MKRAIVDLSSLVWTSLLFGKDKEYGREYPNDAGKMVLVNSASYGYENAVQYLNGVLDELGIAPSQVILVKEGMNSKAERQRLHPLYKAGRDKLPQQYEEFTKCRDQIIASYLSVGANMCWQDGGVEGDDVIGYLTQNLEGELWIISGDKDLASEVGGNVHHYRAGAIDVNPFGDFPHRLIPVWIALVGDAGDKIPGAKGFGEKAGLELVTLFGPEGLELMEQLILHKKLDRLAEDVGEMPKLQKIVDDVDGVYLSYQLGRLRTEKVNTMQRPLCWQVGMVKPRATIFDERLRKHGGVVKLIHAGNFAQAYEWAREQILLSPSVSLDVETSTPPESDEWLEAQGKDGDSVDVFGSELTSLQLTFGPNKQYTVYLPLNNIEEDDVKNLTLDQIVAFVDLIPRGMYTEAHNAAFELPVCYNAWGKRWESDADWHGFLRNVIDTRIMSSYVDENRSAGLKGLSKDLLGYDQVTYEAVTTKTLKLADWNGEGKLKARFVEQVPTGTYETKEATDPDTGEIIQIVGAEIVKDGDEMVTVQLKMNQLTAREVLSYGADDTICTSAVGNYFRIIMELEHTWGVFMEVEQLPAYLTAKGFIDGVDFSLEDMAEMEKDDNKAYDEAWPVLRDYLIKVGFDGTVCPVYDEVTPANVKEVFTLLSGLTLKSLVRKNDKLSKVIEQFVDDWETAPAVVKSDDDGVPDSVVEFDETAGRNLRLLAAVVHVGDVNALNELVKSNFKGEPTLDLASSKQMARLVYDKMGLPINIINDCTINEKMHAKELAAAVRKFKQIRSGKDLVMTPEEMVLVRKKAKVDDTAIDYALAFDADVIADDAKAALKCIGTMKKVMTRRSLFYKNYWKVLHWKDGKIHASANQCAAVTRRYSMSNPNLQQLPKKGEGVRFRGCFKPHRRDAVICSIDFSGQELRLAAERSQDKNMLACFIGDNLKDIHSITAANAMKLKWGVAVVRELFASYGADLTDTPDGQYDLFLRLRKVGKAEPIGKKADDLRKDSKNVNFAAQFGGQAAKLSDTLIMPLADAQLFLDARSAMFPDVDKAAKRAEEECQRLGYATTLMGARRHLRAAITSEDRQAASRAARQAWNMEIQGSAGEMTKLAMARLWKSDFLWKFDVRFIAPIHDELVTSIRRDHLVEAIKIKHACMTQKYASMTVPVLGSISIGKDFAAQIECGDWYIAENIESAANDIFVSTESKVAA